MSDISQSTEDKSEGLYELDSGNEYERMDYKAPSHISEHVQPPHPQPASPADYELTPCPAYTSMSQHS